MEICDGFEVKCVCQEIVHPIAGAYNIEHNIASEDTQTQSMYRHLEVVSTYRSKDGDETTILGPGMLEKRCFRSSSRLSSALSARSVPGTFLRTPIIGTYNWISKPV